MAAVDRPDTASFYGAVWWSKVSDWMRIGLQINNHFESERARTGHYPKEKDGLEYIMHCEPPPGRAMTPRIARVLFTICRESWAMKGGRPPGRQNP
jgi:hypothetical protein